MPSQGPNSGGTAANTNLGGFASWSNTGNVFASDNSYASAVTGMGLETTHGLDVTNFGFTVPSGATIDGVLVEIEEKKTGTVTSHTVQLLSAGSTLGTNQSGGESWHASDTYLSYGSSSSLWGATLTDAVINASTFGVRVRASLTGIGDTAYVDHVRITVYYHVSSYSIAAATGSYSHSGNAVGLEFGRKIQVAIGDYLHTGQPVALTHGHPLAVGQGAYPYTGSDVRLYWPVRIDAGLGVYPYTGLPVGLFIPGGVIAEPGHYTYTGNPLWPVFVTSRSSGVFGVYGQVTSRASGVYAVANNVVGYNVYAGEDALPDFSASPTFSATLPISVPVTPPVSGTKSVYVAVRKQDRYGLESQNQNTHLFVINSAGNLVMPPLPTPDGLTLAERPSFTVRVMSSYANFRVDDHPATHWQVFAGNTPPDPLVDAPAYQGPASPVLAADVGPYAAGTVYVVVRLYRIDDVSVSPTVSGTVVLTGTPPAVKPVLSGFED